MVGRAMFTTVMSRMIMSWAPSTMARAIPRRSSRRAPPWPPSVVIRAIDDVDMNAFLERRCVTWSGQKLCCPARLRGAFEAPLRLAEGARPRRGCFAAPPTVASLGLVGNPAYFNEVPLDLQ